MRGDRAQQREQAPGASTDSKTTKSITKQKVSASARSSASKSIKSKVRKIEVTDSLLDSSLLQETITDSESENEPKPPGLKRKVKQNTKTDNGEVQATGGIAIQIHSLTDCGRRNSAAQIQKQSATTLRPLRSQWCA